MKRLKRNLTEILLGLACVLFAHVAYAGPEPELIGLLNTPASGKLFSLRWSNGTTELQGWRRLGDLAGSFRLVSFNDETGALTLNDSTSKKFQIFLPVSHVKEQLTDEEFTMLRRFVGRGNATDAPTLSRAKARALWFRLIEAYARSPEEMSRFLIDAKGDSLPPDEQERFRQSQKGAAENGRVLVVVLLNRDLAVHYHELPRNLFNLPSSMVRNLSAADWEELSLLSAGTKLGVNTNP